MALRGCNVQFCKPLSRKLPLRLRVFFPSSSISASEKKKNQPTSQLRRRRTTSTRRNRGSRRGGGGDDHENAMYPEGFARARSLACMLSVASNRNPCDTMFSSGVHGFFVFYSFIVLPAIKIAYALQPVFGFGAEECLHTSGFELVSQPSR